MLDVLIIHDDHEAENDAFYIMGTGGDVDLTESRGATHRTTVDVVIEDDEDQTVRIRNSKFRGAPTNVYEPAGDPEISNPVFWVDAEPNRNDLPLEVRLDMVDLNDQTVSSAKISLSAAALTLNDGDTGDSDLGDRELAGLRRRPGGRQLQAERLGKRVLGGDGRVRDDSGGRARLHGDRPS